MSQTVARTTAVPAATATRTQAVSRLALLILVALLAAFLGLGIIDLVRHVIPASARPVGTAIVAVVMAVYAAGGAVGAAVLLPRRG